MTSAQIVALVGEALYGSRWQTDLAEALKVSDRTMRRWVAGTASPPGAIIMELVRLLEAQQFKIGVVIGKLKLIPMPGEAA